MVAPGVDLLRIAARIAVPETCPVCKALMLYDDGREAYACNCGFEDGPAAGDMAEVAAAVAAAPAARAAAASGFSCKVDLSIAVDFEGPGSEAALVKKLKLELMAAVRSSLTIVSRELRLKASGVTISPVSVDVSETGGD